MKHEKYGCACCSGDFGEIFKTNNAVQRMVNTDPAANILSAAEASRRMACLSEF